jgi:hypothetical protein
MATLHLASFLICATASGLLALSLLLRRARS